MEAAALIRTARQRSGLSLRRLARAAGTSHATVVAYEAGRKEPSLVTLARVVRAAGFTLEIDLLPAVDDAEARGRELLEVLELAEQFPARHEPTLRAPKFQRAP
ncbi:MAG: helix-turn-helix transcriptional regulator [Actinobacteria bacterium]|nr:helix-turn-helix transcriptional regulator [Actinomycetota bacterium]